MTDKENRDHSNKDRAAGKWCIYRSEVLAALVIIVLVIAVAFGVNKFFYGFDHPELAFTDTAVTDREEGQETVPGVKRFVQSDDWRLLLVNRDHPMEEEFDGELTDLRYGQRVDSRIYPDLQEMFDEMRLSGLEPRVVQGYRTREEQEERFENKIKEYMGYGKSREEARKLAIQWVAEPGTSEHETGMCVDISSESGDNDSANEVWEWMDENCSRFGFIKRYPNGKSSITGIKGEPWHYRYVGAEAAQEITERGITLEEYLGAVSTKTVF